MTNGIIIRNGVKYAGGSSSSSSDVKVVDVVEKGNKDAVSSNAVASFGDSLLEESVSDSVIKSITGQENIFTKNYSFKTYGIQFFGDSIPYGVGVDDDSTDMSLYHRWPTVFCSKVEATEINQAVSGSLYSVEKSGVATIKSKLQTSLSSSYPYLFINGGINDWQWGISLTVFANAVDDTFNYIKTNYSGHVVIISPFNVLKNLVGSTLYPLNEYRKILAQKAYKYGFDYINGGNISLAKGNAVGAKRYQFSDGLHPSGFGHYLIAHELIQQFFNLTWDTYDAMIDHDELVFSGKYLAGINAPIWKVLHSSLTLPASPSTITLQRIDSNLSNDKVIIQSLKGCIMYTGSDNNSWSCPLPLYNFNSGVGTMQQFNFYSGGNGLDCQYQSDVAIINGNLFVEFIRWFDLNNTHNF